MSAAHKNKLIAIYRDHYRTLFNYGYRIIANEEVVKDCIQDSFVYLWNDPSRLDGVKVLKNYLLGILRNLLLKQIALEKKNKELKDIDSFSISIEDIVIENENKEVSNRQMKQAISSLSPKQKEIIYLRFYEGLSYQEIEKILNINYQSARNLLLKAVQNLRKVLLYIVLTFFIIF